MFVLLCSVSFRNSCCFGNGYSVSPVMVNYMYQLELDEGYADNWQNILSVPWERFWKTLASESVKISLQMLEGINQSFEGSNNRTRRLRKGEFVLSGWQSHTSSVPKTGTSVFPAFKLRPGLELTALALLTSHAIELDLELYHGLSWVSFHNHMNYPL